MRENFQIRLYSQREVRPIYTDRQNAACDTSMLTTRVIFLSQEKIRYRMQSRSYAQKDILSINLKLMTTRIRHSGFVGRYQN